jgi:hypothetical protein
MSKSSEQYSNECITIRPRELERKAKEELDTFLYWIFDNIPGVQEFLEDRILNSELIDHDDVDSISEKAQELLIEDPHTYLSLLFNPKRIKEIV